MTSTRDKQILIDELTDVIDGLRPITKAFPEATWRAAFETEARKFRALANGCPEASDARREYNGFAIAHQLFLDGDVA